MAKMKIGEVMINISEDDYNRFARSVQGNPVFRTMRDGRIINVNHVQMVEGSKEEPVKTPEPPEKEPVEKISADKLRALIDKSGLSIAAFAESVGYSPTTVIMALKKGNVSGPFSNAVMEKYGD